MFQIYYKELLCVVVQYLHAVRAKSSDSLIAAVCSCPW